LLLIAADIGVGVADRRLGGRTKEILRIMIMKK